MENQKEKELVEKRLQEFSEYFVDEFDTKILWYRKILDEKSDPATGGAKSTAITGSKQAISGGVSFGTGIPFLGPIVAGVYELGGKKIITTIEERTNKKEADSLFDLIYNFKGKENQVRFRRMLLEACFEIFHSFEKQFMNLTVKNGGETRAMLKLAKDIVNKIIEYFVINKEEFSVPNITKAIINVETSTFKSFAAKILKSGRTVLNKNGEDYEEWNTKDLFTKVGLQIKEDNHWIFYTKSDLETKKYGYRQLFTFEIEKQDVIKQNYSIDEIEEFTNYDYIFSIEDKINQIDRIFNIIHGRDPNKMEERLKDACENTKNEILKTIENNISKLETGFVDFDFTTLKEIIKKTETEILNHDLIHFIKGKQYFEDAKHDRDDKHKVTISLINKQNDLLNVVNSEIKETLERFDIIHSHVFMQANIPIEFQIPKLTTPFVGRVAELSEIKWGHLDKKFIVISGVRGVGKSQLAIKYSQDYKHGSSSNIIWIKSESHETLISSFKDLAVLIGNNLENKTITAIVRETISYFNQRKTLFIFDNSTSDNLIVNNLKSFIGESEFISVIITSMSEEWNDNFKVINLSILSKEIAIEYIKIVLNKELNNKLIVTEEDCEKLAEFHEYLPLALRNSTVYILQQNILRKENYTIDDYIAQFSKQIIAPPPPEVPPSDDVIEETLLEKLEQESQRIGNQISDESARIGDQISDEAARVERQVTNFFKEEVGGFIKSIF